MFDICKYPAGTRVSVHPPLDAHLPEWEGVTGTVFDHPDYPNNCVRFDRKLLFWRHQDWAIFDYCLRPLDETPFAKSLREYIQSELE